MMQLKDKELDAFKDGVFDGLLDGNRAESHINMYFYKRGYDFGLYLFNASETNNEED